MTTTNVLNKDVPECANDALADSTYVAIDETDDLEEFPVLLQSRDIRELIEAAKMRGLSATGLARRLVRDYLQGTRGVVLVGGLQPIKG